MIFPNSQSAQSINANPIPQFFNPAAISLPFAYNGAQINYRDSTWLKLNACELFLKNECPNVDNCSLAHPPNTVKIENNKVTVCYDYIKKKDCKHGNCKYYHPHDALASAILRRGDDSKKNGNSLSNLGLSLALRSPLQMPRSQDLFNLHAQSMLSSQMSNNNLIAADTQMKAKLEVMRQLNAANAPQAWLPGLNVASAQALVSPTNPTNVSLHSLLSGVTAKPSILNPTIGSTLLLSTAISSNNNTNIHNNNTSLRPTLVGIVDNQNPDIKYAGVKRAAPPDSFGTIAATNSSHIYASNDNNIYGLPDLKKVKPMESEGHGVTTNSINSDLMAGAHYYLPAAISTNASQLQPSSATNLHLPTMTGTANLPSNFNLIPTSHLQTAPLSAYHHQLGSFNVNNLLLQSLLNNNQSVTNTNPNLETLLAFSGQKLYTPITAYPQLNMAQMPLINQMYYQQLLQNSLGAPAPILYPGNSINIAELQQRTLEETSVAFINDKGTILETLPVCKDFLQGKCKRNQSCNYVHLLDSNVEIKDSKLTVCKNALKGQCHRPVCKFYHIPTYQLQKLGLHNQVQ